MYCLTTCNMYGEFNIGDKPAAGRPFLLFRALRNNIFYVSSSQGPNMFYPVAYHEITQTLSFSLSSLISLRRGPKQVLFYMLA